MRPSLPTRTYEIHEVAELTGLDAARLRAWERRYALVRPRRMPNGYRVYSAEQVALLRAYARLIEAGERIGDLAARAPEEVLARAAATRAPDGPPHAAALLEAVRGLDRERLEALVAEQLALRGLRGFAADVVLPLAESVGDLWSAGELPIAAEHVASEVILHALKGGLRMTRGGPPVVCGCLPGERHEWGFLATLALLQEDHGWRIHYLGPDLPVPELARAAWKLSARAAALSGSDPAVVRAALPALAPLPGKLPPGAVAVIGGAGVLPHAAVLRGYGFRLGPEGPGPPADARRGGAPRL
jgi:MerR family transcriptional regulator, light-induced transcriptional regulator